jgi:membrane dipeptidase
MAVNPVSFAGGRRQFLAAGAAAAGVALTGAAVAQAQPARVQRRSGAGARMMMIDAMGFTGDPDPGPLPESPPSARMLQDLRDSGLTATSLTLSVGSTGERMTRAIRRIAVFDEKIAAAQDTLIRIRTFADLQTAWQSGRVGFIYNLQDTSLLENDLARVATLQALGVRQIQMTYNTRNLVGDGCLERANAGLSNLGRELVGALEQARVVMDLSHGGENTIAEALSLAKAPPIISHTGCRNLTGHPRNVYDREMRVVADKGGVVGIYFMYFLVPQGNATKQDLIRHIEHAVNVCGEDHVGIGTDGRISPTKVDEAYMEGQRRSYEDRLAQGIAAPREGPDSHAFVVDYNDARRFSMLADDLAARGWPAGRIEKLLGGNIARVYREVWG